MDISELRDLAFKVVDERLKRNNCETDVDVIFLNLVEEVGEISKEFCNLRFRKSKYDKTNLEEEVADVLIDLLTLSKILNIDIEKATISKLEKVKLK